MRESEYTYRPAWWVPGRHLQTLWGKLFRRLRPLGARTEIWETPDGDSIEMHRVDAPADRPRLFLLHGLEGSVRSHYVGGLLDQAKARGWGAELMMFRGCGDAPNRARRFYHSGETTDVAFAVQRVRQQYPAAPLLFVAVSLGANVLLKWLGELGDSATGLIRGAVAISTPFDLARGARYISRGFSRVYEANFVSSLRRKAVAKLALYPDLFDHTALERARSIWDFDDVVTAPVHGFRDAQDYYARSSSLAYLRSIRVPTLLLSAEDDPFLPSEVLDEVRAVARENECLYPEFTEKGGHVGFIAGRWPWKPDFFAERRAIAFLADQVN